MPKHPAPLDFADWLASRRPSGLVDIPFGDKTFTAKLQDLFTDDEYNAWRDLEVTDAVGAARLHLGDQYDDFVATGGTGVALMEYLREVNTQRESEQGASSGESGASSRS